jgi:hypothetical protein
MGIVRMNRQPERLQHYEVAQAFLLRAVVDCSVVEH